MTSTPLALSVEKNLETSDMSPTLTADESIQSSPALASQLLTPSGSPSSQIVDVTPSFLDPLDTESQDSDSDEDGWQGRGIPKKPTSGVPLNSSRNSRPSIVANHSDVGKRNAPTNGQSTKTTQVLPKGTRRN